MAYPRMRHGLAWAPDIGLILVVGGAISKSDSVEGMWRDWREPSKFGPPKWVAMRSMLMPVKPFSMAYFRGHFVFAGGNFIGNGESSSSGYAFMFKPPKSPDDPDKEGSWSRLPNMYAARRFHSIVGTRNRIYGFGKGP